MSSYSIIGAVFFLILGIMILVGKVDKLFTRQTEKDMETPWYHRSLLAFKGIEKYSIKRLRLVWGLAFILFGVSYFFRDPWYIIMITAIVLTLVAFILQETWAKKKDPDLLNSK